MTLLSLSLLHFLCLKQKVGFITQMSKDCDALQQSDALVVFYSDVVANSLQLQKELEQHYLRQEAHIRKRVTVLDELLSCMADERHCLEVQHQECRVQISNIRKHLSFLQLEQSRMSQTLKTSHATLEKEEEVISNKLSYFTQKIEEEDTKLDQLLKEKEVLDAEEAQLEEKERRQFREENELEKALREINNLAEEIDQRKKLLDKRNSAIAERDQELEARELELTRCQDTLREDLRHIETDEKRLGVKRKDSLVFNDSIAPIVSQRQIMDDFDMTIEHENHCVEIDKDDDEEEDF
ncbi:hypothetical protein AGDE_00331 [Angomonas deanei]|nr:hypothetical protein AGDE_05876 [Angomonas deanei]EPY43590.1 hypothetical protein AGDE_00331 [Angomonas deanei]|eukprot:EPY38056.1 hypothetical protein AGDE_05876 [Angomonas deanei]